MSLTNRRNARRENFSINDLNVIHVFLIMSLCLYLLFPSVSMCTLSGREICWLSHDWGQISNTTRTLPARSCSRRSAPCKLSNVAAAPVAGRTLQARLHTFCRHRRSRTYIADLFLNVYILIWSVHRSQFFWRRRNFIAKPLLREAGVGAILLENPFYGLRKPKEQMWEFLFALFDSSGFYWCLLFFVQQTVVQTWIMCRTYSWWGAVWYLRIWFCSTFANVWALGHWAWRDFLWADITHR